MADETRETREENYEQDAYGEDAPQDVEQAPEDAEQARQGGDEAPWESRVPADAGEAYEEPAPELGTLNPRSIPGNASHAASRMRKSRIGAFVVQPMPFDLAAARQKVAQHGVSLLGRLAGDDMIVAENDCRVLTFRLREKAQCQDGVRVFRSEQTSLGDCLRHAANIAHGHCRDRRRDNGQSLCAHHSAFPPQPTSIAVVIGASPLWGEALSEILDDADRQSSGPVSLRDCSRCWRSANRAAFPPGTATHFTSLNLNSQRMRRLSATHCASLLASSIDVPA